jgi:hypothetical protein
MPSANFIGNHCPAWPNTHAISAGDTKHHSFAFHFAISKWNANPNSDSDHDPNTVAVSKSDTDANFYTNTKSFGLSNFFSNTEPY